MLSDEEKQAIEYLESRLYGNEGCKFIDVAQSDLRIFLKLVEKQQKEIEHQKEKRANQRQELAILNAKQIEFNKLVNTVNSYKGQFKRQQKEIEELNKENTRQHELIGNIHKKWEDKIKAKIEEVDYKMIAHQDVREAVKQVLKSLLEKE